MSKKSKICQLKVADPLTNRKPNNFEIQIKTIKLEVLKIVFFFKSQKIDKNLKSRY